MKNKLLAFLFFPSLVFGAPFDLLVNQRNIADTATATRTMPLPALGVYNIIGTDAGSNFPAVFRLSQPFGVQNGELVVSLVWDQILNKPVFSTVATSGDYNDLTNRPAINAQVNSDWSAASGSAEILNKPTTLAGYGISDAYPLTGNPSSFLTGITGGQVTTALGFTPYNATNPSAFVTQAGARAAISLTTTGTSGPATYNSSTGALNIPNYAPSRSQASATRALNTAFQISSTRDAMASYSVQCVITASIAGGQACDVILEIATDVAFTTGVQTVGVVGTGQTYTLAVALQGVQPQTSQLFGYVPAGYYARIRTVSVTGAPSFSMRAGQEILQ